VLVVDRVLLAALALVAGQLAPLAPQAALAGFLGVAWLFRRALPWAVLVLLGGAFACSAARAELVLSAFDDERIRVRDAISAPSRCAGTGVVRSSPVVRGGSPSFIADFEGLECDERRLEGAFRVRLYGGPTALARGDLVEVIAQLAPLQLFRNPSVADPTPRAARSGVLASGSILAAEIVARGTSPFSAIDRARARVRVRISATFAAGAEGMARALVLGENDLTEADDEAFRKSGLSHMLAVSGTHLVFAVLSIVHALTALFVRIRRLSSGRDVSRLSSALGIPLALVYADFAGGSGSAYRAAWMLGAIFLSRACGRCPDAVRALALSLGGGALVDPLVAYDISFLLSAAATSGLLVLGAPLAARCSKVSSRVGRFVGQSIAATVSSMVPCAPLLAVLAPELTLAGVLSNVLAAPFGELVALPLCLSHGLTAGFPELERGIALVASGALLAVKQIAHESAAARALAFEVPQPSAAHLLAIVLGGAALLRYRASRWPALACVGALALALVTVELAARRSGAPEGALRVTALDVGQGDSTLVELPNGAAFLVDAGGIVGAGVDPGRAAVLPVLRAKRRKRLEFVVLSHPHPDHFAGLAAVLDAVEVGEFWDTGQGEREGAGPVYAALLADLRARGVPILGPRELCDQPRTLAGVTIDVLMPCPGYVPHRDANDNSFVMKLRYGERAVLLTGDAEMEEEAELVAHFGPRLRADFLKVGHHGSRTSTGDAFLDLVRPSVASISCGVRNRFGHPHGVVLERLVRHGVEAARTDRGGAVTFTTDGTRMDVETVRAPR
jgi:competence protein ComEC